ncbi:putative Ig domain-containing protein [Nitrospira sp. NS4]|uniref:putative Ig domain-containing protein n=1 Tax=Nitrospira sp. NS4 TaxID=3414498 RepID=UPI003C2CFDC1
MMRIKHALTILCLCTATATLAFTEIALGAIYPLELAFPRAAGSAPTEGQPAISPNHRIFWAYPGIEYNIRASVIGGTYPYSFSLTNAPSGMTINSTTGEISWPNPQNGNSVTPTITVRDAENSTVSASWTITVDASRFIFIDAVNGREWDVTNPGTGTVSNPLKRIRDMWEGDIYESKRRKSHVNKIAYFREGTYHIDGTIERYGSLGMGRMAVLDAFKPVAWLAYPGETPTIDGQCFAADPQIGARPCNKSNHISFYDTANNTYIDGFRVVNMAYHAFRVGGTGHYQVFRRNHFNRLGPTEPGVNEGWITTISSRSAEMGSYMTIQDNIFEDVDRGAFIKLYSTQRTLIEDNICRTAYDSTGGSNTEGIAIKGGPLDRITVRHNIVYDFVHKGIGGNMHPLSSAEILFNRVYNVTNFGKYAYGTGTAVEMNQDGLANNVHIYRNTFVGRVSVRNTDSSDGPFTFSTNVIINNDPGSHIYYDNVSDPSRIVATDNLVGAPSQNIIDQGLNLTSAYSSYVGTRGYQLNATGETLPAPASLSSGGLFGR